MATRLYHPSDVVAPPNNSLAISATWTASIASFFRTMCSNIKRGSAMTTFSYTDADNAQQFICFAQFHSPLLTPGQTITSSQNLTGSVRCLERIAGNNLFRTVGLRVMNGTTEKKVLIIPTAGTVEVGTSLVSSAKTNALAATNYTTVTGDYLVAELGLSGNPANTGGADHDGDMRFGDVAASDCPFSDGDANDYNGWIEIVDSLTFVAPTVALTGTVTTALEADIVAGGKTVILTLTGASWITAGALFDAQRQAIINGMDSAQSEAAGWDVKVKGLQGVAGVVRTSATVVTITLDAQAAYAITANETITVTVPGSAIATGVGAVASPTFVITAASGDMEATGVQVVGNSAILSGAGNLVATGVQIVTGIPALNAVGNLGAVGNPVIGAQVISSSADIDSPAPNSDIAALGAQVVASTAILSATGELVAVGAQVLNGIAALSAYGSLVATGTQVIVGIPNLTAAGNLAALGTLVLTSSAAIDAPDSPDMSALGALVLTTSADLKAVGALAALGVQTVVGVAALNAQGNIVATGVLIINGVAILSALGNLVALGTQVVGSSADLDTPNAQDMHALGAQVLVGVATLNAEGELVAVGLITIASSAGLDYFIPSPPNAPPISEFEEDYFRRYVGDKEGIDTLVVNANTSVAVAEEDDYYRRYLGDKPTQDTLVSTPNSDTSVSDEDDYYRRYLGDKQ